jgi:hypothetical protein
MESAPNLLIKSNCKILPEKAENNHGQIYVEEYLTLVSHYTYY